MAEKHKKRADGRYQTTATIDGKRKFFFGKTFKEATENKETYLKTVQAAPHVDYNITLGQWLAIWLKGAKNTLSESSFVSYLHEDSARLSLLSGCHQNQQQVCHLQGSPLFPICHTLPVAILSSPATTSYLAYNTTLS
ncbi:hypothetical protein NXG27_01175 [Megasphaera paucivorans]|uniref:AP2-like DNA-binding integrase domain-containing protein n=1 Tax=Megasphaera paucivorans TaxID=349095 RepID=A0A1G9QGW2_9FIRM|nr:hypothetical protein [Megasphaera paucivorans]SDM10268.1 hypothetical protein SAMN05660299_00236 [Megasphaera paucivorans]